MRLHGFGLIDNHSFEFLLAARDQPGCGCFGQYFSDDPGAIRIGIFALGASVDLLTNIGITNIEQRALFLNRFLTNSLMDSGWNVLSPLDDEQFRSAETLVAVDHPARVVAQLAEKGVIVTEKPQGIRIATDFFNNESDVVRLIEALGMKV